MAKLDITGQRFGRLVALTPLPRLTGNTRWLCRCDCGNEKAIQLGHLRNGDTKSCGCFRREFSAQKVKNHGQSRTRLYNIWCKMLARCSREASSDYIWYGARGISVCQQWGRFEEFSEWALANGYRQELSIDRIDNDGNYEPGNCRWATAFQQAGNSRQARKLTVNGRTACITEHARRENVSRWSLARYTLKGMSADEAVAILKARSHETD